MVQIVNIGAGGIVCVTQKEKKKCLNSLLIEIK